MENASAAAPSPPSTTRNAMKSLIELRQERGDHIANMRKLADGAAERGEDLSSEEQSKYDGLDTRQEELRRQIGRQERADKLKAEEDALAESRRQPPGQGRRPPGDHAPDEREKRELEERAFRSYLRGGLGRMPENEARALSMGSQEDGGYIVLPERIRDDLIKGVDDDVYMRQLATVERLERAGSLGTPTLDADPSDPEWTSEIRTGSEDDAMRFGKRSLEPKPLAKRIKISRKLIHNSNAEGIVVSRLRYKFGVAQEKGFLVGSGANQPLGVFTASPDGISTARDVVGANTATVIAPTR